MKKNTVRALTLLVVFFVAYHVIAFAVPFPKTAAFWVSYAFTLVALFAQVYVMWVAFVQCKELKSVLYGVPIARIGICYLAAQTVLGLVFMATGATVPLWLVLVVSVALFGGAVAGFIAADSMRDEIVRQDVQLTKDVACMRALQSKADAILSQVDSGPVREAAGKLADDLRFSDPVSGPALREIEAELTACVDEIQKALTDGDSEGAVALLKRADTILLERNRLCKLNKSAKG